MKIYTKTGDQGKTGLYGGGRVSKTDLRILAYGTVDEVNALFGVAIAEVRSACDGVAETNHSEAKTGLTRLLAEWIRIQGELFQLGAELATPDGKKVPSALVGASEVAKLEAAVDQMENTLQPLKSFVLPGGHRTASYAHFLRTVVRRAERDMVALHQAVPLRAEVLVYMNRLSDYVFVCARMLNQIFGVNDVPWNAPRA